MEHFCRRGHPLILRKKALMSSEFLYDCDACKFLITPGGEDSIAYECAKCRLFLHKRCVQAPTKIKHPTHPQHSLDLVSPLTTLEFNDWDEPSMYICLECDFRVEMRSALDEPYKIVHTSHNHPLTFQWRQTLFNCEACGIKSEDSCYLCSECNFWIHQKCASLPVTIEDSPHHNHTLTLAYSFPGGYETSYDDCSICHEELIPEYWLYYCGGCRYFIHVNCASTEPLLESDYEDHENLDRYPHPDGTSNAMSQLLKKLSLRDAYCEGEVELQHWDHKDHPLILWDGLSKNEVASANIVYDRMFCVACLQPINPPFYHCSPCDYFLHICCAVLPLELQHPCHPKHPLTISHQSKNEHFGIIDCACCDSITNGFSYSCKECHYYLDIACANLPVKILHESHKHPLVIGKAAEKKCNACDKYLTIAEYFSNDAYKCESRTCRYEIHLGCATRLPRSFTHDYDKHPITLRYSPAQNQPSDYYCEICEERVYPKFWFYHCDECIYSFHTDCIFPIINHSMIKCGDKYKVDNHEHPLTLVHNEGHKSSCLCTICGYGKYDQVHLKCAECDFLLCCLCGENPQFVMSYNAKPPGM